MAETGELLGIYLHLARASEVRNRPLVRDKLLVLSGVIAAERGLRPLAAYCRQKVLASNPNHLLGHYPTLSEALEDERFQHFLARLRKHYSRERAEYMLSSLGIDLARERAAYFDDYEYAAALLGTTPDAIEAELRVVKSAAAAADANNPYSPPATPLPVKRRPLVLADHWLALAVLLALVVLPLVIGSLLGIAWWLGRM
ncbi:MAG TPA: hypothetical protein VMV10_30475 [Pirellulales bacterium]|nr:hypothetical protein [Pirellulales bacterium]